METFTRTVSMLAELMARSTMRSRISLPVELWIYVFNMKSLNSSDAFQIRLTCRAFAILGKPVAFRAFDFRPVASDDPLAHGHHSARLAFWSSQSIAPFVERCAIQSTLDNPTTLLHVMFFNNLSKFVNLSSLRCECVQFDDYTLDVISRLPKIQDIALVDCDLKLEMPPPRIVVNDVHFGSNATENDAEPSRGRYGWLDILCPSAIRELSLKFDTPGPWSLRGIMTHTSPSTNIDHAVFAEHLALVISHPKALESLTILPFGFLHRAAGVSDFQFNFDISLPSLRAYSGALHLLRSRHLTPTEKLTSLTLHGIIETPPLDARVRLKQTCDWIGFLSANQGLEFHPHAHAVRELDLTVIELSDTLFDRITAEYPNVRVLSITVDSVVTKVSTCSKAIESCLTRRIFSSISLPPLM